MFNCELYIKFKHTEQYCTNKGFTMHAFVRKGKIHFAQFKINLKKMVVDVMVYKNKIRMRIR